MKRMKSILAIAALMLAFTTTTSAQAYRSSKYYNPSTGTLDYSHGPNGGSRWSRMNGDYRDSYVGFRIGPAFSTVSGDDKSLNGDGMKTGLNIGFVYGKNLIYNVPLYFETGLSYIEKGGNGTEDNKDFKYTLDYLELPFVAKYIYNVDKSFSIQPYLGGYVSVGVGGKVKNYGERESYSSFGTHDYQFKRFDGGLKMGCGFGYDLFYGEIGYELGLANICHDDFDESSNSALTLTVGINF